MQYTFLNNRLGKMLFGGFLFLLLLLVRDTLISSSLIGFYPSQFMTLGLILIAGILFLVRNYKSIKEMFCDGRMIIIVGVVVIVVIPMLVKQDWQMMYFSILLCLLFAVFLTYFATYEKVAYYYVITLSVLAAYSILAQYVFKPITEAGWLLVPKFNNPTGIAFYNYGLAFVRAEPTYYRNFGIFREPGVYQFFIILALFLNNYVIDWEKQGRLWLINAVLAVTMVSTFSTNGVFELVLLAIVLFFDKKMYKNKKIVIGCIVGLAALFVALGFIIIQQGPLYWTALHPMINKLIIMDYSASSRFDAIFTDIVIFLRTPIFGEKIHTVMYAVDHNTTSTLLLFCVLGIAGGLLSVISWIALVWDKNRSVFTNIMLLIILFMSFNTQNLIADIFFWMFPMMAFVQRVLPWIPVPTSHKGKSH